jgi:hypothetical protein
VNLSNHMRFNKSGKVNVNPDGVRIFQANSLFFCLPDRGVSLWYRNNWLQHFHGMTGYGLDDRIIGVRLPAGTGNFSLHHVQTGSGAHAASYLLGTAGSLPGGKAARTWS